MNCSICGSRTTNAQYKKPVCDRCIEWAVFRVSCPIISAEYENMRSEISRLKSCVNSRDEEIERLGSCPCHNRPNW